MTLSSVPDAGTHSVLGHPAPQNLPLPGTGRSQPQRTGGDLGARRRSRQQVWAERAGDSHCQQAISRGLPDHPRKPARMFSIFNIWGTFNSVLFYLSLLVSLAGLGGNALLLWHLGLHIKKGPFNIYLLHLAAADFLFLACQVGFSIAEIALGYEDTLHFPIIFLWFAVGLWLLAAFAVDCCLAYMFPSYCSPSCRPRYTSAVLCLLIWALTMPAVLLPANACGLLYKGMSFLVCLSYHWASVVWLVVLAVMACGASKILLICGNCCSGQPLPKFCKVAQCSGILLFFCRLPMVVYWSLRPVIKFLLPFFLPLATLLACIDSSAKPLLYYMKGRQLRKKEPLQVVLNRALGEESPSSLGGLSLPMRQV
ncbi:mas-related G-protein coupled receptor member G isoform X1 [Peromyscus leucopus]|uniref:mas-related G-protein coupled receptor member G isoform X1 n=2 Tax=Peromyscus leucopus TaxID=10041 RepID=UPI00188594EC|nr:mas-related G-protein coupled receptor member G isoform X1 [Peromyscus leucopus]